MTGDFSRWRGPNARRQGYTGVLMQQGRLYTDSDWNEAQAIATERAEDALARVIGPGATPETAPGFAISAGAGGFQIGAGAYWVAGVRVENPAPLAYADQPGAPALADTVQDGAEMLIHLELRKDQVSALQDGLLADPALSGADTAVRERALWRVALRPVSLSDAERAELIRRAGCGHAPDFADWQPGTGRMSAGTAPAADLPEDSDCLIPPDAGYLSQENQLYRVEILQGGSRAQARFGWSRENGSVQARLARNAAGQFILQAAREDEALGFPSGTWVEVVDDRDVALGRPGRMVRMTLADGVASFAPGIGDFDQLVNPRLRRWDHGGTAAAGLPLSGTPTLLERGVQVSFTDGSYVAGDAWMFEARAATGAVVWPPCPGAADEALPPMTWGVRRVPLALARRAGAGIAQITDLRATFPALSCLQAEDVGFDDSTTGLDAETVQEAIEALARRASAGLCTVLVHDRDELRAAVEALVPGQNIRICLSGANFQLQETLRLTGLGHVTLQGTGPQTVVSVAQGEAAFLFDGCISVRVVDLSVNGGPNGTGDARKGRHGALTMLGCGDVTVERVRARCRAGQDRASACIASQGRLGRQQEVRIRDCVLKAGQAQIGIQIVGASRVLIEDNLIQPVPAAPGLTGLRIATDARQRALIARGILRFGAGRAASPVDLTVRMARQPFSDDPIDQSAEISTALLNFSGEAVEVPMHRGAISARIRPLLASPLLRALAANGKSRISDAREMRRHIRNLLAEAAGNRGRAMIAGNTVNLLPGKYFRLAETPFVAQGIVIGGDAIDEARITGNRIEAAIDGIRLAASGRGDENPPIWRDRPPANRIEHAVISGNTITLNPLSSATPAHGLLLGHVARANIGQNSVTMAPGVFRVEAEAPQFGICQIGWRGPLLSVVENNVSGMENGIAVIPGLSDAVQGIWRLRDNAAFRTRRAYVSAAGVEVS
ncbi:MAG: DUF6519 domain-containing protein [Paracoccus aminovorans]|nr:DUF6519 domain-containing protein [Paracoccus aminovorans]